MVLLSQAHSRESFERLTSPTAKQLARNASKGRPRTNTDLSAYTRPHFNSCAPSQVAALALAPTLNPRTGFQNQPTLLGAIYCVWWDLLCETCLLSVMRGAFLYRLFLV